MLTHGRWSYRHCRDGEGGRACQVCRAGHAAAATEGNRERAARLKADPSVAPHGEASTYLNWGCRCTPCRQAATETRRRFGDVYRPVRAVVEPSMKKGAMLPAPRRRPKATPIGRDWINTP